MNKCPNCNAAVQGFFATERLLDSVEAEILRVKFPSLPDVVCTGCAPKPTEEMKRADKEKEVAIKKELLAKSNPEYFIPVISVNLLPSIPIGEYKILGLVSAQTIKSTGFLLDIASGDTGLGIDFSNTKKTTLGEKEVIYELKKQCHELGGNLVIGLELDFSESGGYKSMMICAQGTAILLDEPERFIKLPT
jgi:uncharacterized protein YbjQ (UPF0145 family)